MEQTNTSKKWFLLVFCSASILEGMYSTYFVSILTTIERIYQIQSKTAGAILSATEIGQIIGSLLVAYYGGRGSKPKWMASCMILTAIAAIASTTPHFMLNNPKVTSDRLDLKNSISSTLIKSSTQQLPSPLTGDLSKTYHQTSSDVKHEMTPTNTSSTFIKLTTQKLSLCTLNKLTVDNQSATNVEFQLQALSLLDNFTSTINATHNATSIISSTASRTTSTVFIIMFLCLLGIGFGSTAITTLGIPYIDDIVSRDESPLYLGATIGLRILGPALGFILGSICIRLHLHSDLLLVGELDVDGQATRSAAAFVDGLGCWWLGPIVISVPLLLLALPMYLLSRFDKNIQTPSSIGGSTKNGFQDITYRAAEDHDIGGSRDLEGHVLAVADLEVTSNGTCYSEVVDSNSREVLQSSSTKPYHQQSYHLNFAHNLGLDKPIITRESIFRYPKDQLDSWKAAGTCLVVGNYEGDIESTSFVKNNDDDDELENDQGSKSLKSPNFSGDKQNSLNNNFPSNRPPPSSSSDLSDPLSSSGQNMGTALKRLFQNKLLMLRILSNVLHILPIAGFYTFLPKYLIEHFRVQASSASAISGLAGILFVGLGAFLGGTLIRVFRISSRQATRWIASSSLLYFFGMLILMSLSCPQSQIVHQTSVQFASSSCATNCGCSDKLYEPICANGASYISACHAGCKHYSTTTTTPIDGENSRTNIVLGQCDCHFQDDTYSNSSDHQTGEHNSLGTERQDTTFASQGFCQVDCGNLKYYVLIFSLFTLIHSSSEVGSTMLNLRCVRANDRTLALGLITFTTSLLGTIPCSVIYGTMIDMTCVHWEHTGGLGSGACRAYENETFRYNLHGLTASVMFLAFLVDCVICKQAAGVDLYEDRGAERHGSTSGVEVVLAEPSASSLSVNAKSSCSIVAAMTKRSQLTKGGGGKPSGAAFKTSTETL